jgi:hypothetical protein
MDSIPGLNDVSLRLKIYGTLIAAQDRDLTETTLEMLSGPEESDTVRVELGRREGRLLDAMAEHVGRERGLVGRWLLMRGIAGTLVDCSPEVRHSVVQRAASRLAACLA